MEDLFYTLLEAMAPLAAAALGWLSVKLAGLINAKVSNEYLRGALVRLDEAVFAAVKEVQQTYVDDIKKGKADGTLSATEKKRAKELAVAKAKEYLGSKGLNELIKILGIADITGLLGGKIESTIADSKDPL